VDVLRKFALIAVATIAVAGLFLWCLDAFGFRSPIFAFLVNWLAMSWVAVTGRVIPYSFPPAYYDIKPFERTGQLYERLGIRLFKKLVRRGPLSVFSPTLRLPKEKTLSALQELDHEMRKAEAGHATIFMLMLVFIVYALTRRWFDAALWLLAFSVIINGYPVMLQRYNRIKLQELIQLGGGAR
jgi:hypothetical protein